MWREESRGEGELRVESGGCGLEGESLVVVVVVGLKGLMGLWLWWWW